MLKLYWVERLKILSIDMQRLQLPMWDLYSNTIFYHSPKSTLNPHVQQYDLKELVTDSVDRKL